MEPPTGLILWFSKTEGNTYATLLHHPFLSKGKPTQCSRGSKKDFGRRCRGGLRKSQHTKYPSQTLISRITLFAICLSFSSPPLHPCCFIRPLFSIRLFFACLSLWLVPYLLRCLPKMKFLILNKGREKIEKMLGIEFAMLRIDPLGSNPLPFFFAIFM